MAGGMRGGRKLKAVIPGGSSMPVLPAEVMMDLDMDYDSIAEGRLDAGLGRGHRDGRGHLHGQGAPERLSYFYYEESCGQCTPCREGTGWLYRMVKRIEGGEGRREDLDMLEQVADNIQGRTICALGDAAAMPVRAFLKHYRANSSTTSTTSAASWSPRYSAPAAA
jgi:NADH-quinone oxidoreductase subunit F